MIYKQVSTSALKELHQSIQRCLSEDDNTPSGQMKPYGVREFNDWSEHLNEIEAELSNKWESYTPIGIKISGAVNLIPHVDLDVSGTHPGPETHKMWAKLIQQLTNRE
jgi:hypothetical protein